MEGSATEAFAGICDMLARCDWQAVAGMADTPSLAAWHRLQLAGLALDAEQLATAPHTSRLALIPTDPAALAKLIQSYGDTVVDDSPYEGKTLAEIAALPGTTLLADYFALTEPLRQASDCEPSPEVIGELRENDDLVHVLYRWQGLAWPCQPQDVAVVTFRRVQSEWRYVLDSTQGPPLSHLTPRRPPASPPVGRDSAA